MMRHQNGWQKQMFAFIRRSNVASRITASRVIAAIDGAREVIRTPLEIRGEREMNGKEQKEQKKKKKN